MDGPRCVACAENMITSFILLFYPPLYSHQKVQLDILQINEAPQTIKNHKNLEDQDKS